MVTYCSSVIGLSFPPKTGQGNKVEMEVVESSSGGKDNEEEIQCGVQDKSGA